VFSCYGFITLYLMHPHPHLSFHRLNNSISGGITVRLWEFTDRWGVYGKPAPHRTKVDGTQSPLTFQGDAEWRDDPDFMHKWFSRPYLTKGVRGNHMLPIKKKKG